MSGARWGSGGDAGSVGAEVPAWGDRLRDQGPAGLRDRWISRGPSAQGLDPWGAAEIPRMLGLYEERYRVHGEAFSRAAAETAPYKLGYTVTRLALQGGGAGAAGAAALGAPQEAAAPADDHHKLPSVKPRTIS